MPASGTRSVVFSQPARVASVNVGLPRDEEWAGSLRRTAIDKRPVAGPVEVGLLGLAGDEVADTKHHGGTYQAVYAFAREDLDDWAGQLGRPLRHGMFGENLTTTGIDVNEALLGERWRIRSPTTFWSAQMTAAASSAVSTAKCRSASTSRSLQSPSATTRGSSGSTVGLRPRIAANVPEDEDFGATGKEDARVGSRSCRRWRMGRR